MANALYAHGKENILQADVDHDADDIVIMFIDEGDDVPDLANDEDLDDRVGAAIVDTSGNLASKTEANGTFDAADITVATVTGDEFESIDTYKDSGAAATSWLLSNHDTGTGLPCTPNGGDITVQWNASGLYSL